MLIRRTAIFVLIFLLMAPSSFAIDKDVWGFKGRHRKDVYGFKSSTGRWDILGFSKKHRRTNRRHDVYGFQSSGTDVHRDIYGFKSEGKIGEAYLFSRYGNKLKFREHAKTYFTNVRNYAHQLKGGSRRYFKGYSRYFKRAPYFSGKSQATGRSRKQYSYYTTASHIEPSQGLTSVSDSNMSMYLLDQPTEGLSKF